MSEAEDRGDSNAGIDTDTEVDTADSRLVTNWAVALAMLTTLTVIGLTAWSIWPTYKHGSDARFVGPKTCAECHVEEAASWSETRMAKSFDVLRPGVRAGAKKAVGLDPDEDFTHDQNCLPCHTTGYGMVGGFVSIEKTPEMAGVSCEACHGHGGSYSENLMRDLKGAFTTSEAREVGLVYPPTIRVCRGCHNEGSPFIDRDYKFDFDERVGRGTHQHFKLKNKH